MFKPTDGYHEEMQNLQANDVKITKGYNATDFTYDFQNFFHPFVGDLIAQLNQKGLAGMLDPGFLDKLKKNNNPGGTDYKKLDFFKNFGYDKPTGPDSKHVSISGHPREIDVSTCGPYANYNWELLFHIPLMIAVHLSKNQRFEEALRWFHFIIDTTYSDLTVDLKHRFWKFLAFRDPEQKAVTIDDIVTALSKPQSDQQGTGSCGMNSIIQGYEAILNNPFQPHAVARTNPVHYKYSVSMKYLDNLIAWGDHLFQQDTRESITESIQIYVLAANFLGERPQQVPPTGKVKALTFAKLKAQGMGPIGDALVDLEGQFPFNLATVSPAPNAQTNPLFGMGKALYFCVPPNDKLLGYWDTVADRLSRFAIA